MRATRGGQGRCECSPACVQNIAPTRLLTATCLRGRFGSTFSCCGADYCCQAGPGTAVLVSKGGRTETEAGGRAVRGTPRGPPSQLAGENAHTRLIVTRLPVASLPVCVCHAREGRCKNQHPGLGVRELMPACLLLIRRGHYLPDARKDWRRWRVDCGRGYQGKPDR